MVRVEVGDDIPSKKSIIKTQLSDGNIAKTLLKT